MSGDSLTRWTGWDGADTVTDDGRCAAGGSGVACFDLLAVAGWGFGPPRHLTVTPIDGESAVADDPPAHGARRPAWSLVYRSLAATAPPGTPPFAIYLLGVNPPTGVTDDELEVFNDFYTNVHLVEVAERRHALRAARFELVRDPHPPKGGAPRFLAVYEVDEAGASQRRHVGPPYTKGPDVWQRHTTPWRLWYRSA